MIDITDIVTAVIGLIVAILTTYFIPWLKGKVDAQKLGKAKLYAKLAVEAAEMIYNAEGQGEEKKKYVEEFLASKGLKCDEETVNVLIESAVCQLHEEL